MGNTVPYSDYAAAQAIIESLEEELATYEFYGLLIVLAFIIAIVALICYTGVKKKQIKYFGSSEEYELFMEWKKKQNTKMQQNKK